MKLRTVPYPRAGLLGLFLAFSNALVQTAKNNTISDDDRFLYPFSDDTIQFASYWDNGTIAALWNLSDPLSRDIVDKSKRPLHVWDPDSKDATRYLPPADGDMFEEERVSFLPEAVVNIYNTSHGAVTRLTGEDPFWPPACERIVTELDRLCTPDRMPTNGSNTMGVTLKHYGYSLPDRQNRSMYVDSYISVAVLHAGPDMIATFNASCNMWFAHLIDCAVIEQDPPKNYQLTPLTYNGTEIKYDNGETVMLWPELQ
ncbi:MAG: hypothetical protein M1838_000976, partial [Thelocarpon superellum]